MEILPLVARVAVALAAVVGLILLMQRAARRRGAGRTVDASRFTVVARQALSRSSGVTVLRVGDEALVLGVTDTQVQLLARMPLDAITGEAPADVVLDVDAAPAVEVRSEVQLPSFTPAAAPRRAVATVLSTTSPTPQRTALAGSALSPATWTSALEVLRERTTRR
ncbi:flagellar biosynthetic protein FliO [Quadrisphaera sp. INWT6]|uniref:flagellar biosynthetic protein FliO n=1 Tax=Quadrisphaera sp. INWT6 TaxID=2596917 RepID=UPI00189286B6|nr:flagellar biosynthetic protein FliO [Quadrisphaera sp. INWT6]MBF5083114.1 flagellar biosynthetic protein FliO [Quadrisphaera sp. INWT6]